MKLDRKLRMGLIGGGPGAFIGEVHRKASRLDGEIELVAGCFDIDPKKSREMGRQLALDPSRVYGTIAEMLAGETTTLLAQSIDFVAITTPNNWHFPIAKVFLEAGFHVMCEKPMTLTSKEAKELQELVGKTGLVFGLMHNYTGYPMVKLARDMVRKGVLGAIRKIVVQYPQGWLATALEKAASGTGDQMQASWRTDPKQTGAGGCVGDIGTHAANLAEYISGLKITHVCADLTTFVPGRQVDDDCNVLLRFGYDEQGKPPAPRGVLHASQISIGEENNLAIWVYGELASLEWHLPPGHPEAFLEAFANNYLNFCETVKCRIAGEQPSELALDFPGVEAGIRGLLFIETVVESSRSDKKWTPMKQ